MSGKKGAKHYGAEQIEEMNQYKKTGLTHREIGKEIGLERNRAKMFFAG